MAPSPLCGNTPEVKYGGERREFEMTAAQFEMLEASQVEELLRARFESLAWHGCPPGNALVIASHLEIELYRKHPEHFGYAFFAMTPDARGGPDGSP